MKTFLDFKTPMHERPIWYRVSFVILMLMLGNSFLPEAYKTVLILGIAGLAILFAFGPDIKKLLGRENQKP